MRAAVQLFAGSADFRAGPEIYVAVRPGLQTLARLVRGGSIQGPSRKWGTAIWLCCRAVKSQVGAWRSTERLVFQLPFVGGPSYTPPSGAPTPDGGFRLGNFGVELEVRVPEPKIEIDLQPLQLLLTFEDENQRDISAEKFLLLDRWIESVKKSHLFPVIRNRYLKIHMR